MKNFVRFTALAVLGIVPFFSSQALILKPEIQFKTFEQIQADAQAKLEATSTLSEDEKRKQRLLKLTRDSNTGVNRVKSAKENFKKRFGNQTRSSSNGQISKTRVPRRASALASISSTSAAVETTTTTSVRDRLRARLARIKAQKSNNAAAQVTPKSNPKQRSSFEFIPQPGQLWGR